MTNLRKIIHIDMDAFYASVEQRDRPELKGKPVIVGGDPEGRGVVAACSYEARRFGIHSAMSCSKAYRLCPNGVFLRPRFEVYKEVSAQIRSVFREYTDLVEPLSLDEAYLDVTENKTGAPSATHIAEEIRQKIRERTGLTASAGVSFNKFLAKTASDVNKPDGIMVVTPDAAGPFIDTLPIGKFFGVGKATEHKMRRVGIRTGADLKRFGRDELVRLFGKVGHYFYDIAHGEDARPVVAHRTRKSLGKEQTFREDMGDRIRMIEILHRIARQVERLLARFDLRGRTITLKVKFFDFRSITRSVTLTERTRDAAVIMEHVTRLLKGTEAGTRKVRLLGITVSAFDERPPAPRRAVQLTLPFGAGGGPPGAQDTEVP